jgi:chemotaxis protein MotB
MAGRRRRQEEHENLERWLLTYADMITLLMAFFIMLYGMSQLDIRKFQAMITGVRAELGGSGVVSGGSGINRGGASALQHKAIGFAPRPAAQATERLQKALHAAISSGAGGEGIEIASQEGAVVMRIPTGARFAEGSADLTPGLQRLLDRVGTIVRRDGCAVRIEGHTCDLPIHSVQFPSNWELSSDRARNMGLYLTRHLGLAPERISCMGYADTRPLVPNTSEANRARNRRVEFVLRPQAGASAADAGPAVEPPPEGPPEGPPVAPPPAASPAPAPAGVRDKIDLRPPRVDLRRRLKAREEAP